MSKVVTTFPKREEAGKGVEALRRAGLPHEVISPDPGYARVGAPGVVLTPETRQGLAERGGDEFVCSGWVDYHAPKLKVPEEEPGSFAEDVFGRAAIMVLAPCVADPTKIRIIAHLSGDLTQVFPYLNAEMREASYNVHGPTFTFLEGYRMITLYPRRIAAAKADEIVDAWRILETIRRRANDAWARRAETTPCYEMREKPPALEIFKRLPRTNCRLCGEKTCLAFAVKLWLGQTEMRRCAPVFADEFTRLKDALTEICAGLGVADAVVEDTGVA